MAVHVEAVTQMIQINGYGTYTQPACDKQLSFDIQVFVSMNTKQKALCVEAMKLYLYWVKH